MAPFCFCGKCVALTKGVVQGVVQALCGCCAGIFRGWGPFRGFWVGLADPRASPPPRIINNIDLHGVRGGEGRASPTTKIIQNLLTFIFFEGGMGRASAPPSTETFWIFIVFEGG